MRYLYSKLYLEAKYFKSIIRFMIHIGIKIIKRNKPSFSLLVCIS